MNLPVRVSDVHRYHIYNSFHSFFVHSSMTLLVQGEVLSKAGPTDWYTYDARGGGTVAPTFRDNDVCVIVVTPVTRRTLQRQTCSKFTSSIKN